LKVVGTDASGSSGEAIVTFVVSPPAQDSAVSKLAGLVVTLLPIALGLGLVFGVGYLILKLLRRRVRSAPGYSGERIRPWAGRELPKQMAPPEEWPERPRPQPASPQSRVLGRIVVMNEVAIKSGDLSAIREYRIGTAPLTLGTGAAADIQIEDSEERIAAEEARLWVQKGRLVYHKLTTLSAMATEGVTSGWLLLADGEDFLLGQYRILFQTDIPDDHLPPGHTPEPVDEETAHSLQEFEDHALQEKWEREQALAKAPAAATSGQSPPTLHGMWLAPGSRPSDADAGSDHDVAVPAVEPSASGEPLGGRAEADAGVGEPLTESSATPGGPAAPAVNFTDAWTRRGAAEGGGVMGTAEIDEETLKALKALEEASLREPQHSASQAPAPPPDSSPSSATPADRSSESAWHSEDE
jgi:hypothetical protein